MKKAIYLKINRGEKYAIRNLSRWIDSAYLLKTDCFIVCDSEELRKKIIDELPLSREFVFIKSKKNNTSKYIVENVANKNWANAAYAHLTTFSHAKENLYDYFWNIDADDTMVCLGIERMVEAIKSVERYAEINDSDCLSLDMWRTKWNGVHWSFGVTYTDGRVNWEKQIINHCADYEYINLENGMNYNIDCFFTYLKEVTNLQIETFYFENLKFIHYSSDFFEGLVSSAFYHWKNGVLYYPIMGACVGLTELSEFPICSDVIKLDIGIKDEEAKNTLTYYSRDGHEFRGYVDWKNITNNILFEKKKSIYLKKFKTGAHVVCFGLGNCFDNSYEKVELMCKLDYVCDNDESKWGKKFGNGIKCISPDELKLLDNVLVIVTVYSTKVSSDITEQLLDLGIKQIDSINNFLKCVE